MIVPVGYRNVIILVLIKISIVLSAITSTTRNDETSQCRQTSNTTLDCSNLNLIAIPKIIPNTILTLIMSFNQLHLNEDTFKECCGNIQEIDLSSNAISADINRDIFKYLVDVKRITLHNNSIVNFDPETFVDLKNLRQLDLSDNPLSLQSTSTGFLVNENLTELNLENCKLNEIPEGSFSNISQLKSLFLLGNPFDDDFDVSAFEDLTSLTSLRMRNLSRSTMMELCEKLTGIDAINFEGFNLSCYILVNEDGNFDDAIVGLDAPIEKPIQLPVQTRSTREPLIRSAVTTTTTTTQLPTINIDTTEKPVENIEISDHHQDSVTNSSDVNQTTTAVVDIDNQTIKYILMGILGVTLVGMLIGVICRADICGIKTKLCRSKKGGNNNNRRSPDDTVSPFEEIPLNTVNTNGKKTTDG